MVVVRPDGVERVDDADRVSAPRRWRSASARGDWDRCADACLELASLDVRLFSRGARVLGDRAR
jgi:hypothetical protein